MDRQLAERLIASALALDPLLNDIDKVISEMPDGAERSALVQGLGLVFRQVNETFIRPVSREFPDLAEKD